MPTFVNILLSTLMDRWREVDILLGEAAAHESAGGKQDFHSVLCRASVVLTVAHLEGFIRDCAKAVIDDINRFSTFSAASLHVKRTFCSTFISANDSESNSKVERLMATFDGLPTKLIHDPFLFQSKHDDNKNPSPHVIDVIARNFGVKKFFSILAGSKLDIVFTGQPTEAKLVSDELRNDILAGSVGFPYKIDCSKYALDQPHAPAATGRSLWEAFLDNLLTQRHKIAHGSNQLNGSSVAEITEFKFKVITLQHAFAAVLCNHINTVP